MSAPARQLPTPSLYDQDFYAWANEQAALLRAGKLAEADIENIAEEIESLGKSEKRELLSRLAVLLQHLVKWCFQPDRRGASWEATIIIQRRELEDHLADNPSLRAKLPEAVARAYGNAIVMAAGETALPRSTFPAECQWSFEQIMSEDFWPEPDAP
jgi:hypothetical protein